ncbi:hypothetical protein [Pseudoduganella sp. UC29_71]|uniref:hypothetical protein n=1 Tax=Pseudoduganella sp. UC29_71 TaxID=3350174 RepID=UPI003672B92A
MNKLFTTLTTIGAAMILTACASTAGPKRLVLPLDHGPRARKQRHGKTSNAFCVPNRKRKPRRMPRNHRKTRINNCSRIFPRVPPLGIFVCKTRTEWHAAVPSQQILENGYEQNDETDVHSLVDDIHWRRVSAIAKYRFG